MGDDQVTKVVQGDGWTVGSLDGLGDGPGIRKIRRELDVTAFGINAIVMPPGIQAAMHWHDEQEETYFVHRGEIEIEFGDGSVQRLGPGGLARVAPATPRRIRNASDAEAVLVVAGGKDGYVGRDGHLAEGEERVQPLGGSS